MAELSMKPSKTPLHSFFNHDEFHGFTVPPNFTTAEAISSRPDDIIIATYPKSGTTWLLNMVYHLVGCPEGPLKQMKFQVPWLDTAEHELGRAVLDEMASPRVLKTHCLHSFLPAHRADKKIIYCYRNPKDIAVSIYYQITKINSVYQSEIIERRDFQGFFHKIFRDQKVCSWGLWEDHVAEWLAQKNAKNILILTYEDMVEDTERELKKIAEFLGVELNEELKKRVLYEGKFETMQKSLAFRSAFNFEEKENPLVRKGKVGGWRGWLSEEQSIELDRAIENVRAAGGNIRC